MKKHRNDALKWIFENVIGLVKNTLFVSTDVNINKNKSKSTSNMLTRVCAT